MNGRLSGNVLEIESVQYHALLEVSEAIAAHPDLKILFKELAARLPSVVPFEGIGLILYDPSKNVMRMHVLETDQVQRIPEGLELPMDESAAAWVFKHQKCLIISHLDEETRFPRAVRILQSLRAQSCCILPVTTAVRRLGAIVFGSVNACVFGEIGRASCRERVLRLV